MYPVGRRNDFFMNPVSSVLAGGPFGSGDGNQSEVRCAVRFPLSLPVVVSMDSEECAALTKNVSASGVCFTTDRGIPVGGIIGFSLRMPGQILGTPRDVLVYCRGRVVRCFASQTEFQAAATIDEYSFGEQ
jgi:hypothetical protein